MVFIESPTKESVEILSVWQRLTFILLRPVRMTTPVASLDETTIGGVHQSLQSVLAKMSLSHHCMLLQVSWCKLEVKLSSPKMVTAGCASRQHPPPLVVAALNLKTTLGAQASPNLTSSGLPQPSYHCCL